VAGLGANTEVGLRVVFVATPGAYSGAVLETLIEAGWRPQGLLLPDPGCGRTVPASETRTPIERRLLPVVTGDVLVRTAARQGIPVHRVRGGDTPALAPALAALTPEVLVVAGFPFILTGDALALVPRGGLNLHPSLLPAYRGPAPLFWQFRDGVDESGVTVHQMTPRADAGPVWARESIAWPPGMSGSEAVRTAARRGGRLMARVLAQLPRTGREPCPQEEMRATQQPWPRTISGYPRTGRRNGRSGSCGEPGSGAGLSI
jgi:methionyl-tRNA formyltransferase